MGSNPTSGTNYINKPNSVGSNPTHGTNQTSKENSMKTFNEFIQEKEIDEQWEQMTEEEKKEPVPVSDKTRTW